MYDIRNSDYLYGFCAINTGYKYKYFNLKMCQGVSIEPSPAITLICLAKHNLGIGL